MFNMNYVATCPYILALRRGYMTGTTALILRPSGGRGQRSTISLKNFAIKTNANMHPGGFLARVAVASNSFKKFQNYPQREIM